MIQYIEEGDGGGTYGGGSSSPSGGSTFSPSGPTDTTPWIPTATSEPVSGSGSTSEGGSTSSATETVAQAYLAALAAQGKNTAGDTSPYVVIPNQADTGGVGVSGLGVVLVLAVLGLGAWWFFKRRAA